MTVDRKCQVRFVPGGTKSMAWRMLARSGCSRVLYLNTGAKPAASNNRLRSLIALREAQQRVAAGAPSGPIRKSSNASAICPHRRPAPAKRRRELIAKTWVDNGLYDDAHRPNEGHEAIDAMIDQAQRQFPGYQLRLISGIETHNC